MAVTALILGACGDAAEVTIEVAAPSSTSTSATTTSSSTTTTPPIIATDATAPTIPAWNGHDAAITWTFDDAFPSHQARVVPYLDELGRPATFYPACSDVARDPDGWGAVAARHEVANHTMTHQVAGPDTDPAEVTACHDLLTDTFGAEPATFAYPSGVVGDPFLQYSRATYVTARGTWGFPSHVEAGRTPDWYALPAHSVIPADEDPAGTRIDDTVTAIETAIAAGGWLTIVIHAIDEPGFARMSFADLERMMAAADAADATVWHATLADVATHDRVRRNVDRVSPVPADDGSWTWTWSVVSGMTDVGVRLHTGTGTIVHDGARLVPDAEGFVELAPRVGAFTWIPD